MRSMVLVLLFAGTASPVFAQTQESRATLSAIGGLGQTFDDESSLGRGWLVGAAWDRVLFGGTRVDVSLETLTHDRSAGYFLSEGRTTMAGVSLAQRFGRGGAAPYVFGGLTVGHHSATNNFAGVARPVSSTDAGYRFGAGLAFRAGARFEISPEFRFNGFFVENDSDPVWIPSFGLRFGWRL